MTGLRRFGLVLGGIAAAALFVLGGLYTVGSANVDRTYAVQLTSIVVSDDSAEVARGGHLIDILGCRLCHGADLGGAILGDEPPFFLSASNLTGGRGGVGASFGPADFDRAIRHGVRPSGRGLVVMPSSVYNNLSDEDAAAIISYLHRLPPVDRELPPTRMKPLGRVMAARWFNPAEEIRPGAARAEPAPPAGPTAEYGEYLTSVTCMHCHGSDLRGAPPPAAGYPHVPDLAAAGQWTFEAFARALRTGEAPGGYTLDPQYMPWQMTAAMTDDELRALHNHLATLSTAGSL
jgi:cytochrome c553